MNAISSLRAALGAVFLTVPRAMARARRWRGRPLLLLMSVLGLAACGGGVYYEDGYDHDGVIDSPPSVSIAANTDVSAPGAALRLVAAASDDYAVRSVEFYIRDARGDLPLVRLQSPPWEITTTVPVNAVGWVTYVARAVDDVGQSSLLATVNVQVSPY